MFEKPGSRVHQWSTSGGCEWMVRRRGIWRQLAVFCIRLPALNHGMESGDAAGDASSIVGWSRLVGWCYGFRCSSRQRCQLVGSSLKALAIAGAPTGSSFKRPEFFDQQGDAVGVNRDGDRVPVVGVRRASLWGNGCRPAAANR
ncbi:unnamed protein product [Lactuca virosa]|uniref:Uncharacterized protein n=1 Tax=Lactuca virosa TaxID=75947 RepID=A0AAU9P759_9ASTR|nr:unnamed protein product [Lactuca virosa]